MPGDKKESKHIYGKPVYDTINWETVSVNELRNTIPIEWRKDHLIVQSACANNARLSVIKYLVEEIEENISREKILKRTKKCVSAACDGNENADVMEYLLKNTNDICYHVLHDSDKNGLEVIAEKDYYGNIKVLKALLQDQRIYEFIHRVKSYRFMEILCKKNQYTELESLLQEGYIKLDDLHKDH